MDFIRIEFEKGEGYYIYRDCLTLTQEQYENMTEQDIENLKEQRYQSWLEHINSPPQELLQE